jgi:hypothetical protein
VSAGVALFLPPFVLRTWEWNKFSNLLILIMWPEIRGLPDPSKARWSARKYAIGRGQSQSNLRAAAALDHPGVL